MEVLAQAQGAVVVAEAEEAAGEEGEEGEEGVAAEGGEEVVAEVARSQEFHPRLENPEALCRVEFGGRECHRARFPTSFGIPGSSLFLCGFAKGLDGPECLRILVFFGQLSDQVPGHQLLQVGTQHLPIGTLFF